MASYKLVIGMAPGQAVDTLPGFLASQGACAVGLRRWKIGDVIVAVSTGKSRPPHATVHIPLRETEPPAEVALELAFKLADALDSQVFDPQLGRVVKASDTAEIFEQLAGVWEPPVEESGRLGQAIGSIVSQSTTSMVLVLLFAAAASLAAVMVLDIPEQHRSNALFAGLLLFGLLFSAVRFLIARGWSRRHHDST